MSISADSLRTRFFSSLDDAASLLRLFDFLPNVFLYVKDQQGRFVAMNEALVQMRGGVDQRDLIGKTDTDLHPDYWGRRYQEEDQRVIRSGREIPDQVWLVPVQSGKLGSFVSSKIPLRNDQQQVIGIAGVMYRLDTDTQSVAQRSPLQRATELIAQRYGEPLRIKDLAHHAGLSISQFNRRFRAVYQMSPSEYIQRVRVHQASLRLLEADSSIGHVAVLSGFYDQAHLTRTFRKWMGVTPTQFRNDAKQSTPRHSLDQSSHAQ